MRAVFRIDSDASSFDWLLVWILFHRCAQSFLGRILHNPMILCGTEFILFGVTPLSIASGERRAFCIPHVLIVHMSIYVYDFNNIVYM